MLDLAGLWHKLIPTQTQRATFRVARPSLGFVRHSRHRLQSLEPRLLLAVTIFDDPAVMGVIANDPGGIAEPGVPIFQGGAPISDSNFPVIEIYDRTPTPTPSYPLTVVDIVANSYLRPTYQKLDGTTGQLGTSIIGSASYRTSDLQFHLIPSMTRADVDTSAAVRYQSTLTGNFDSAALTSKRTFPDPVLGATTVGVDVALTTTNSIDLAAGAPYTANDRFRAMTVSSMFLDETQFDANLIRFQDVDGNVRSFFLTDLTPRGTHLLPAPQAIGSWFELVKTTGSTYVPDSPTIHVDILDTFGARLGLQGFLANSTLTSDDSLNVWLEWLNAPDSVPTNTPLHVKYNVIASPPRDLAPAADAGGPYRMAAGALATLSGSGSEPGDTVTLAWDLDGDGNFGETGSAASRGNEIGESPTFNAAGLVAASTATVTLRVTDSAAVATTSTATIHIEAAPSLSISDAARVEGNAGAGSLVFNVTLSSASISTTTVRFATSGGSATPGADFVATNGTLTFIPGVTSAAITVTVSSDSVSELDETLQVNLTNPVGATISDGVGVGTILNDDYEWHNATTPADVDRSSVVSGIDLVYVVEALNTYNGGSLVTLGASKARAIDVSGDNNLSGIDLVLVVASLNAQQQFQTGFVEARPPLSASLETDDFTEIALAVATSSQASSSWPNTNMLSALAVRRDDESNSPTQLRPPVVDYVLDDRAPRPDERELDPASANDDSDTLEFDQTINERAI